jgi:hypothetical protein
VVALTDMVVAPAEVLPLTVKVGVGVPLRVPLNSLTPGITTLNSLRGPRALAKNAFIFLYWLCVSGANSSVPPHNVVELLARMVLPLAVLVIFVSVFCEKLTAVIPMVVLATVIFGV